MSGRAELGGAFALGVAAGAALAILLRPSPRGGSLRAGEAQVEGAVTRAGGGHSATWARIREGMRSEWTGWLERRPSELPLDLPALRRAVAAEAPEVRVEVGLLAPGIVELVGVVRDEEEARGIVGVAGVHPGVRTVINRLWVEGDER